jgi:superfamily II DNA or RNA helicase
MTRVHLKRCPGRTKTEKWDLKIYASSGPISASESPATRMLKDLSFKLSYRSDRDDLVSAFFEPALSNSTRYDRATGYFCGSVLKLVARGLRGFIRSGGTMRLVASPQLPAEDVEAISKGYTLREQRVEAAIERTIEELERSATTFYVQALTWLVANRRLDIRIALATRSPDAIYHEKIGVFSDGRDSVAFTGSANETGAALGINLESIDVFTSWNDPQRVAEKIRDFEELWADRTDAVRVYEFPKALHNRLVKIAPEEPPFEAEEDKPSLPDHVPSLRDYQKDAIAAWRRHGYRGIWRMATGTGKTLTAIRAARNCTDENLRTIVILAPYKHLVEQWADELRKFACSPIICHSEHDWRLQAKLAAHAAAAGNGRSSQTVLVSTYETACSSDFSKMVTLFPESRLLIADEVHTLTLKMSPQIASDAFTFRLGLSATPERYLDDEGTREILNYFDGVIFEFGLRQAIEQGFLTPYRYIPVLCSLTDPEELEYQLLMKDIKELSSAEDKRRIERLRMLLKKRASVIAKAANKLSEFERIAKTTTAIADGHALIYCNPETIKIIQHFLGHELHIYAHTFTAHESQHERADLLRRFEAKELKALVAIRCLDEGVDVPATRTAFLLASSANPKQFVQRRGRILRRAPGKQEATIYDFIALPQRATESDAPYLQKELTRFLEFAHLALNKHEAMRILEVAAADRGIVLPPYGAL